MNILMVCREIPYPLNAGYKIRTFNLLKRLSKNNCISLLCYDIGDNALDNIAGIQNSCETIRLVNPRKNSKMRQIPSVLKNFMTAEPFCVKYVKSAAMKAAIIEMINTRHFDLIHFDDPYITTNFDFDDKGNIKTTVTYHDIDSRKFLRIYKIETNIRKKMMLLLDLFFLKKWEWALVKKADLSIVMSHIDAKALKSKDMRANITIIPNGVDTEIFLFNQGNNISNTIAFFGNMDHFPNQDAVFYFYQQVLPIIRHKKPEVKFIVVGRNPSSKLKDLAKDPNVIVTGNVDNVIPYYYKSSVAVVPLRAGGGTRLKILEAMAVGCPVVSSVIGSEGLDVTHGENILVADTPEEFANLTVELMTNKILRKKLTVTARKFVERRYSWDRIADVMIDIYLKLFRNEMLRDHTLAIPDTYEPDVSESDQQL